MGSTLNQAMPVRTIATIRNHLSPKLDISYALSTESTIYGRYANGFRIPQASRLYSLRTNNIDFELEPEVSDTFEMGYKLATSRHELEFAVYYMVIDDSIVRRENEARERFFINGGKTFHKGVEFSVSSKITREFKAKLAYSYSKHEFDNDPVFQDNDWTAIVQITGTGPARVDWVDPAEAPKK